MYNFQNHLMIYKVLPEKWPQMNTTEPHWWLVNNSSGNGLVPLGTKPLPEPVLILTKIHDASVIGPHWYQWISIFIRPTKVGHIMVWRVSSVRPSVNIWLSTGVTTCHINFNFTDIIHLVCPIHDAGNGPWSSLNMHILTQLLIFTFW